jgi:hypothetical protein
MFLEFQAGIAVIPGVKVVVVVFFLRLKGFRYGPVAGSSGLLFPGSSCDDIPLEQRKKIR